jgi:hypothetical protein
LYSLGHDKGKKSCYDSDEYAPKELFAVFIKIFVYVS